MIDYDKFQVLLRQCGMDEAMSHYFAFALQEDEKNFPVDDAKREWALKKGFFPGRVELYNLDESNYGEYLPDYSYYMMHPLNNHFKIWVNDKLTLKYVLDGAQAKVMPEYYLYIDNDGFYTYLMDIPGDIVGGHDFIPRLLERKGILAMKPNNGAGGRGFIKLEKRDEAFWVNNKETAEDEVLSLIDSLRNYTITEYIHQHEFLSKFWPDSECTLRIIMVKAPSEERFDLPRWHCLVSYARFGTAALGGASNLSSGGIGVGVDYATGKFVSEGFQYKGLAPNGQYRHYRHPNTNIAWEGRSMPHWNEVRSIVERSCERLSALDYLGFDVIVSDSGPKFCEINTMPCLDYEQVICKPILADSNGRNFFECRGLSEIDASNLFRIYRQASGRE